MPSYRLYFMADNGHIERLHEFEANDDSIAIGEAEQRRDVGPMELWCNARKVKRWDSILDRPSS
jgi:hypothetical protein